MIKITKEEADKLLEEGVAADFSCPCKLCNPMPPKDVCEECDIFGAGSVFGFFGAREGARKDIILCVRNDGYFIRAAEDLVTSDDGLFVAFCDDIKEGEKLPNFEDVFTVKEL